MTATNNDHPVNPVVVTETKIIDETYEKFVGKDLKTLNHNFDTLMNKYEIITDEAGPEFNLMKTELLSGGAGERIKKYVGMHSELTGIQKAISFQENAEALAKEVRDRTYSTPEVGNEVYYPNNQVAPKTANLYNMIDNTIQFGPRKGLKSIIEKIEKNTEAVADISNVHIFAAVNPYYKKILNDVMQTTDGVALAESLIPGFVTNPNAPPTLYSLLPMIPTELGTVTFYREDPLTDQPAATAENAALTELDPGMTKVTVDIRKIGGTIAATEEQIQDVPQALDLINNQYPQYILEEVDKQLASGSGVSPNILGLLNTNGATDEVLSASTAAEAFDGSSDIVSDIRKARTRVVNSVKSRPDIFVFSPELWEACNISKATANGTYLAGNPVGTTAETLWAVPVVEYVAAHGMGVAANNYSGMALATSRIRVYIRSGLSISLGYSSDDWINDRIRFKGTVRLGVSVTHGGAICRIKNPSS